MNLIHVASVPQFPDFFDGFGLLLVQFFKKISVYLPAVGFTHRRHLKHIEQEIFFACKNVHQIPQTLRRIWSSIDVNMDSAIVIRSGYTTRFPDSTDNLLKQRYIIILQYRSDEFHRIISRRRITVFVHASDAGIVNHRPLSAFIIADVILVVTAAEDSVELPKTFPIAFAASALVKPVHSISTPNFCVFIPSKFPDKLSSPIKNDLQLVLY